MAPIVRRTPHPIGRQVGGAGATAGSADGRRKSVAGPQSHDLWLVAPGNGVALNGERPRSRSRGRSNFTGETQVSPVQPPFLSFRAQSSRAWPLGRVNRPSALWPSCTEGVLRGGLVGRRR